MVIFLSSKDIAKISSTKKVTLKMRKTNYQHQNTGHYWSTVDESDLYTNQRWCSLLMESLHCVLGAVTGSYHLVLVVVSVHHKLAKDASTKQSTHKFVKQKHIFTHMHIDYCIIVTETKSRKYSTLSYFKLGFGIISTR